MEKRVFSKQKFYNEFNINGDDTCSFKTYSFKWAKESDGKEVEWSDFFNCYIIKGTKYLASEDWTEVVEG